MNRIFLIFLLIACSFNSFSQNEQMTKLSSWQHTTAEAEGNVLKGTDTIFSKTDLIQASEVQVTLKNEKGGKPAQSLVMEVIYDDFAKEQKTIKLAAGQKEQSFTLQLDHYEIRNVAVVRLYGKDQPVEVSIEKLALKQTGQLPTLNDADQSKVKFRPGPFEKYGVIRATYPMAKPPFFMGVNSRDVTIQAYAVPEKLGESAESTLMVTCIDSDKAWRKEFSFKVTEKPDTFHFEIPKDLEAEYEGYFMIFMPAPQNDDIAIRMVEMK